MRKLVIAIVEDEQPHRELLEYYIGRWAKDKNDTKVIIKGYESTESFLFQWQDETFDMIFIDIQMPEGNIMPKGHGISRMNGMDMARKIREGDRNVILVFTTGITDFMQQGYEVEALNYLIKPLDEEKVRKCLDKLLEKEESSTCHTFVTEDGVIKLKEKDIYYVEARGHYCVMKVKDSSAKSASNRSQQRLLRGETLSFTPENEIFLRESLTEVCKRLEGTEFMKCHRSYLCSVEHIYRIGKSELILDDGSNIPVSRRHYDEIVKNFVQHFRKM